MTSDLYRHGTSKGSVLTSLSHRKWLPTDVRSSFQRLQPVAVIGLAAWALVPVLFPFYIFKPGRPQISSVFLVLSVIAMLIAGLRLPAESRGAMKAFLWFVWYVCLVNLAWVAISGNLGMLKPPLYYIYNLMAMSVCLVLYRHAGKLFLNVALHSFVLSGLIQAALLLLSDSGGSRHSIYFDNPNQLGYFALVGAAIVITLGDYLRKPMWYIGAGIGSFLFLVLAANSFAALGGFGLLILLALVRRPGMAIIAILALTTLSGVWQSEFSVSERVASESEEMEGVSFAESRGYDRILNYPEYIFLGSGEGNYNLYESFLGKHEIHSSFGTLLFSYGIVGLILFTWFVISVLRGAGWRSGQFLLPVLLYGLAHQGLRSTMLWLFVGVLICLERRRVTQVVNPVRDSEANRARSNPSRRGGSGGISPNNAPRE